MNKAFVRESDSLVEYCPRCGAQGTAVGQETLEAFLSDELRGRVANPASFCPTPQCPVVYFDAFERVVLADELVRPVYPKDPDAPLCGCFGLTRDDIERDVAEGVVTRTRACVQRANSPEAHCARAAVNGQSCVAWVQKYYMQCVAAKEERR